MEMIWKRLETILRQKCRVEGFIIPILDCGNIKKCKVEKNEINIHIERIDNDIIYFMMDIIDLLVLTFPSATAL
jgi:hypothetical protein